MSNDENAHKKNISKNISMHEEIQEFDPAKIWIKARSYDWQKEKNQREKEKESKMSNRKQTNRPKSWSH